MFSGLTFVLGLLPSTPVHYNSIFITPPGTPLTAPALALGALTFFITGIFSAVIIALIADITGTTRAWLIGGLVGAILWPVHVKVIPLLDPELFEALPLSMVPATLIFSVSWGLIAGVLLQYLPARR